MSIPLTIILAASAPLVASICACLTTVYKPCQKVFSTLCLSIWRVSVLSGCTHNIAIYRASASRPNPPLNKKIFSKTHRIHQPSTKHCSQERTSLCRSGIPTQGRCRFRGYIETTVASTKGVTTAVADPWIIRNPARTARSGPMDRQKAEEQTQEPLSASAGDDSRYPTTHLSAV